MSWFSAQADCAALTAQLSAAGNMPPGYHYRLSTKAEWEYACRAGTTTEFNVGAELHCQHARFVWSFHSNSGCSVPAGTAPVGGYAPNAWRLFDMHGNVVEWCLDTGWRYPTGAVTDPFVNFGNASRVSRGGGYASHSNSCRSAYRNGISPRTAYANLGFRVVFAPILIP